MPAKNATPAEFRTPTQTLKHPIAPNHYTTCYACDGGCKNGGVAERWDNGKASLVYACKRHMDPTIKVIACCIYCGEPVRAGSLNRGDGMYAHHRCAREYERD